MPDIDTEIVECDECSEIYRRNAVLRNIPPVCPTCVQHIRDSIRHDVCHRCHEDYRMLPGEYITYEDNNYCNHCYRYCTMCENVQPMNIMSYDEERDRWYCYQCREYRNVIRSHNFNPMSVLNFIGTPKDKMFFGVELEVEVEDGPALPMAKECLDVLGRDFVVCKHDGSVHNGYEIVTGPTSFEEHYKRWEPFFARRWPLSSWNERCGMHVHLSRAALTPMHLARMMVFMYSPNNRAMIETVAGRTLSSGWGLQYAEMVHAKKLTDIAGVKRNFMEYDGRYYIYSPEGRAYEVPKEEAVKMGSTIIKKDNRFSRYTALNDANENTVEIRIFKGTLNKAAFFKNLEFCHALYSFCRPGNVSFKAIEDPYAFAYFVAANRGQYRNLFMFLSTRGYLDTTKAVKRKEKLLSA